MLGFGLVHSQELNGTASRKFVCINFTRRVSPRCGNAFTFDAQFSARTGLVKTCTSFEAHFISVRRGDVCAQSHWFRCGENIYALIQTSAVITFHLYQALWLCTQTFDAFCISDMMLVELLMVIRLDLCAACNGSTWFFSYFAQMRKYACEQVWCEFGWFVRTSMKVLWEKKWLTINSDDESHLDGIPMIGPTQTKCSFVAAVNTFTKWNSVTSNTHKISQ